MSVRPRTHPHLYEISAWPWLERLSRRAGRLVTLGDVPDAEWDRLAADAFDYVYLMGVWRRSALGRLMARTDPGLLADYDRVLPGWGVRDIPGSPYAVQAYEPDERMGGWDGLDRARAALSSRGIGLVLDFVANHTALDHEWIRTRPELYVQGTIDDLRRHPDWFHPVDDADRMSVIACGRDPFFPPWRDVAQLNYFNPATRDAMRAVVATIAAHCDGVRCDMAMLVLNDVFRETWKGNVDLLWTQPPDEFWPDAVRGASTLVFLAEVYWGRERDLQRLGFHYTYDKPLVDRLRDGSAEDVRGHLRVDGEYNARQVRFLENHDEPRAAATFGARLPAAAAVAFTVPGMRFFFDGQFDGATVRSPVQLGRWAEEPVDTAVADFYRRLLAFINQPLCHEGTWRLLDVHETGISVPSLVAGAWSLGDDRAVAVANLSSENAEGLVQLPSLPDAAAWMFEDRATGERYRRTVADLASGLHVWLAGGHAHLFMVTRDV